MFDVECGSCGHTAPAGSNFCRNCGNPLTPAAEAEADEAGGLRCRCGEWLEANTAVCPTCARHQESGFYLRRRSEGAILLQRVVGLSFIVALWAAYGYLTAGTFNPLEGIRQALLRWLLPH